MVNQSVMNLDARYTVSLEWCGKATQQYVARFCGKFLSSHDDVIGANDACYALAIHRQKISMDAYAKEMASRDDRVMQGKIDSGMFAHIYNVYEE